MNLKSLIIIREERVYERIFKPEREDQTARGD